MTDVTLADVVCANLTVTNVFAEIGEHAYRPNQANGSNEAEIDILIEYL